MCLLLVCLILAANGQLKALEFDRGQLLYEVLHVNGAILKCMFPWWARCPIEPGTHLLSQYQKYYRITISIICIILLLVLLVLSVYIYIYIYVSYVI